MKWTTLTRRGFCVSGTAAVALGFDFSETDGFRSFYNLDFDRGIAILEKDTANSSDADLFNHLASGILYRALFRADALDAGMALRVGEFLRKPKVPISVEDRSRFEAALGRAKQLAQARLAKNAGDANALYALGIVETNRANIALLVDKEWRQALKTGGEARHLHTQALEKDKNLVDALLVPSMHEYILGSLPFYLKALGFLVGFSGDKDKGIDGLRQVAKYGTRSKIDAQVLLALVEHREEHPERAVDIMRGLVREFPLNHLYRRELANLLLDSKRKDEARREFAQLSDGRYRFLKAERLSAYKRDFEAKLRG